MEKVCFVVMGFGKKMDYRCAKEVDLDVIYKNVIQRVFGERFKQYKLVRADEISGSNLIDVDMYTLLMRADLVIADITTLNANAIYELGVRHALKPYATIIMMQDSEKTVIPFDLNHCRVLTYKDYGEKLDDVEALAICDKLEQFITQSEVADVDSPFYTFHPEVLPPECKDDVAYEKLLKKLNRMTETVWSVVYRAEEYKQKDDFTHAYAAWSKAHKLLPHNEYITQQRALACYKSELPNKALALQNALEIIKTLSPDTSLDIETLGITGAIYKRLYEVNNSVEYLEKAIKYYRKGFVIKNDYYNGENYANCLLFKAQDSRMSSDEKKYLLFESDYVYRQVICIILSALQKGEADFWMYATLAVAYYYIGEKVEYQKYEQMFMERVTEGWQKKTYQDNLNKVIECIQGGR